MVEGNGEQFEATAYAPEGAPLAWQNGDSEGIAVQAIAPDGGEGLDPRFAGTAAEAQAAQAAPASQPPETLVCPRCANHCEAGATFCSVCGMRLPGTSEVLRKRGAGSKLAETLLIFAVLGLYAVLALYPKYIHPIEIAGAPLFAKQAWLPDILMLLYAGDGTDMATAASMAPMVAMTLYALVAVLFWILDLPFMLANNPESRIRTTAATCSALFVMVAIAFAGSWKTLAPWIEDALDFSGPLGGSAAPGNEFLLLRWCAIGIAIFTALVSILRAVDTQRRRLPTLPPVLASAAQRPSGMAIRGVLIAAMLICASLIYLSVMNAVDSAKEDAMSVFQWHFGILQTKLKWPLSATELYAAVSMGVFLSLMILGMKTLETVLRTRGQPRTPAIVGTAVLSILHTIFVMYFIGSLDLLAHGETNFLDSMEGGNMLFEPYYPSYGLTILSFVCAALLIVVHVSLRRVAKRRVAAARRQTADAQTA